MKQQKLTITKAWMSIGVDGPIQIAWRREYLRFNVKRIPVSIVPTYQLNRFLKRKKK